MLFAVRQPQGVAKLSTVLLISRPNDSLAQFMVVSVLLWAMRTSHVPAALVE
jgi:hypothetical protein